MTTDDATLLMYAFSPGRKGPTPRGLSREEVAAAYAAWRVVDEQPFAYPTCPHSSRRPTHVGIGSVALNRNDVAGQ